MKLIDRYLVREIAPYFLMGFVLLTSMIFLQQASRFSELFIVFTRYGLPTGPLFGLLGSVLPAILVYTIPVSLLLAVLMGLGRLSADSEITALRASGVGRVRLLYPLLVVGLAAAAAMFYLTTTLAPVSKRTLASLKEARGSMAFQGISTQIKPRVFEESVPGKVFYIREIDRADNTWHNIFIADVSGNPEEPRIFTARTGRLTSPPTEAALPELHLDGMQSHAVENTRARNRLNYTVATYEHGAIVFESADARAQQPARPEGPPDVEAMSYADLLAYTPPAGEEAARDFEVQRRLALPLTAVVFVVIGLAFGVSNQRAGRSFGLLVGLLLTVAFYALTLGAEQFTRKGALPVWLGVWSPNIAFLALGAAGMIGRNTALRSLFAFGPRGARPDEQPQEDPSSPALARGPRFALPRWRPGFPRIVDRLIVSDLARQLLFAVAGMTAVFLVVTLFELVGSIVANHIPTSVVLAYVTYLTPQIVSYLTPLSVLVAVMATFGVMAGGSQIVALKASGQSVYRLSAPVFAVAALLAVGLFLLQNFVLPVTNRQHQDLRQLIKSGQEPARTLHQLDRQWVFGRQSRIFYFRHYDAAQRSFASLSVFDLDPDTFEVRRRTFAETAAWDEDAKAWKLGYGWYREFENGRVTGGGGFKNSALELPEGPEWFTRSTNEADLMAVGDLRREISELSQSGFDVLDLRIELQRKLASPLACLVMALVGLPFAFSVGRRGALFGVAVGLGIGLVFWGAMGLFTQMGRYELLPPVLAAWGPNLLFGASGAYLLMTAKT